MSISRSVSYAVGILMKVAQDGHGDSMTAAQISKGAKFPPRFLYRVLRRLVDAGLLRGVSGPGGGYALARPAAQIHLLEIAVAIEGPREPALLEAVHPKYRQAIERANATLKKEQTAIDRALKRVTLARMLKP